MRQRHVQRDAVLMHIYSYTLYVPKHIFPYTLYVVMHTYPYTIYVLMHVYVWPGFWSKGMLFNWNSAKRQNFKPRSKHIFSRRFRLWRSTPWVCIFMLCMYALCYMCVYVSSNRCDLYTAHAHQKPGMKAKGIYVYNTDTNIDKTRFEGKARVFI
jgi:hypothetical protein